MTQEEKQLLLIDLCARLPYHPVIRIYNDSWEGCQIGEFDNNMYFHHLEAFLCSRIEITPYLRPMSSMTEEERKELRKLCDEDLSKYAKFIIDGHGLSHDGLYMFYPLRQLDFLNSHHFDYRGLIPMGLALEAPKDMYKTE